MNILFTPIAWEDYTYWQTQDKKTLRQINKLIDDICRHPTSGIGKPEPLKWDLAGCWSRRIDLVNRLVYRVTAESVHILSCRYHYQI